MFKLSVNFNTNRSKAALLLWIPFVICVSCLFVILSYLFLAALWSPVVVSGLLSEMFSWVLSLSYVVFWYGCVT